MPRYFLSISSQKLVKAASEKISRIFQLISKDDFVFLDLNGGGIKKKILIYKNLMVFQIIV